MPEHAVAAVDCGTNSTRLLVAGADGRPLERLMRITRLGSGVDRTHRLDPGAIGRTVAVLHGYRAVMDRHGVRRVRMTATSAARDAGNRAEFFDAAAAAIGTPPEMLTGDEEARLSFAGAVGDLRAAAPGDLRAAAPGDLRAAAPGDLCLVADIGGGSTELAVGPVSGGPIAVRSLDVGCVRLSERFLHGDPPSAEERRRATEEVERALACATSEQPELAAADGMIGLAGTVASLAALDQGLVGYDRSALHHHWLRTAAVERLLAELGSETLAARRSRPAMEKDRADVIVGGAIVLAALLRHLRFDGCLTSEADILDGLVSSLIATPP